LFTACIAAYQQAGDPHGQARALANLGNSLAIGGNSAEAAEAFNQALTLARRSRDRWHVAYALFLSGQGENLTGGDQAVARARVAESAELFCEVGDNRAVGYARVVLAACLLAEGQPGDALVSAREGMRAFEELPERWGLFYGSAVLAASAAGIGDWPCAAMLLGVLDTLGDRTGGQLFPHLQAVLDELASEAAQHLGPALSAARKAGRVTGRSDRITPTLWPAANEGGESGAGDRLPLTRRERQIAGLIAEGLTNRQIAARLVIAERTADTHVSRILAKLGCANRAQVAAIVTATTAATTPSDPGRLAAQLPTAQP
jgi:DNA-binding NarL/FixJ family response regulator